MADRSPDVDPARLRAQPLKKWRRYDAEVLPLWVADMDFPVAEPVRAAVREAAEAPVYGYLLDEGLPGLREAVVERLGARYGWTVEPDWVMPLSGIMPALDACVRGLASHADGVLVPTPVYPPFLTSVEKRGRLLQDVPLRNTEDGFRLAADDVDARLDPSSRLLLLCHPHNPTGRVFSGGELEALAQRVLDHRLWVVSDELHADLNYGAEHRPFASLDPALAQRTVTLYGPTKAFNIAGLGVGFAIVPDEGLRARLRDAMALVTPPPNRPAQAAARAAMRDPEAEAWLRETLAVLRSNRDHVREFVDTCLPGVRMHSPEATYLAWLDFRDTPWGRAPADACFEAGVALADGRHFGEAGRGFARLNFATSRAVLEEGLGRIRSALHEA